MKNTLDVRNKIVALHKSKSDPAKLAECLYFTNQLLTSSPGLEREARAAQYRLLAKRIPEKSSLLWQALGCAMIILGASMVTLGTICLMTTIPGFGITTAPSIGLATAGMGLLNLGLFTRSHHESAERKMQRLSSVVNREEPGMILSN